MRIDNQSSKDIGTSLIGEYVQGKGIALLAISKSTGIAYDKLRRSLRTGNRALRLDEFLKICSFLEVDPMRFKKRDPTDSDKAG